MKKERSVSLKLVVDLFFSFARISLLTVGGGPAMIPLVIEMATEKRGWLSKEEMMDCLTISQSLPGGIIINMAAYIGRRLCGTPGMISAAFGVVFPTAALAIIVGLLLGTLGENVYALGAIQGAKAAAVGLVLATFFKLGKSVLNAKYQWLIAIAAIAAVVVFHISAILVIVAGAAIGLLTFRKRRAE